jgi:hypothetical protein
LFRVMKRGKEGKFEAKHGIYVGLALAVFVIVAVLSFNQPSLTGFAIYNVTSGNTTISLCGNITEAGTYTLNQTVELKVGGYGSSTFGNYEVCLTVQADNVIIDGANYSVVSNDTGVKTIGILTANASTKAFTPLTLQNITVYNFSIEVYAAGDGANTAGGTVKIIDDIANLTGLNVTLNGTGTGAAGVFIINYTQGIEDDANNEFGENLGGLWIINRTKGEIKWHAINSSNIGGKLDSNISIGTNLAFVHGATDVLNGSANVTLYSISDTLSTPSVYENHTTICIANCYNYTKLTGNAVTFNVTGWSNYTILDNGTAPRVTINIPTAVTYTDSSVTFNVSLDKNGTVKYSLDGGVSNISMNYSADGSSVFGDHFKRLHTLSDGTYVFNVYANDTSGNQNHTEKVTFNIDAVADAGSTNQGGGSFVGAVGPKQLEEGAERRIIKGTKIRFTFDKDGVKESHTVQFVSIEDNAIRFVVESEPVEFILNVRESKNVDLDADGTGDVKIELLEIVSLSVANIKLTSISKDIVETVQEDPTDTNLSPQEGANGVDSSGRGSTGDRGIDLGTEVIIGIILIILIALVVIIRAVKKRSA